MNRAQAKEIGIAIARSGPLRLVREQHQCFTTLGGHVVEFYPLFSVEVRQLDGSYTLAVGENGQQVWYADWTKAYAWMVELDNMRYWTPIAVIPAGLNEWRKDIAAATRLVLPDLPG